MRRLAGRFVAILVMTLTLVTGASTLAAATAADAHGPRPWRYDVTDLGFAGVPTALNDRGDVVGEAEFTPNLRHPFLWQRGRLIDLGEVGPYTGVDGMATDINNRGQVVGYSSVSSKQPPIDDMAFIWQRGIITPLGIPGRSSVATAINDRGQVAGAYTTATGVERAFLWQRGAFTDLGRGRASDIDKWGRVYGTRPAGRGRTAVWVWHRGRSHDLTIGRRMTWVSAANNHGWVVGTGGVPDSYGMETSHGYLLRAGRLTDLGHVGIGDTTVAGINDRGEIVGSTGVSDANEPVSYLWRRGVMIDLTRHGVPHAGVTGINARGQLAAVRWDQDTGPHALLYTRRPGGYGRQ